MRNFIYRLTSALVALAAFTTAGVTFAVAAEPIHVGETFLTSGLDPTKGNNGWALTSHGIGEDLFTVDKDGKIAPQLALSAERIDDKTWNVKLRADAFYSDGSPVTAASVAAGLGNTIANNKAALATGGNISFTALDATTLQVVTERPVPILPSLLAEWTFVVYRLDASGAPLFTGPYEVKSFAPDASIDLAPNPYYPGASSRTDVTIRKFGDAQTMALAFEAGNIDIAFGLPPESISHLKTEPGLAIKSFPVSYQYMAWFNLHRPQLADARVRQAIDLAFDRNEMVAAINGGEPATGAYAPYFPFAGSVARPHDVAAAEKLLDAAGFAVGSDGMRRKAGVALSVTVVAYPQRPDLVTLLPVVKAELARIGIGVETRSVDNINAVAASGDFDVLLWAQNTVPSGDPAFFLNNDLRSGAAQNFSGYANPAFDRLLDGFNGEADMASRAALAAKAQQVIFDDAPVSYLVTPEWYVGLSKRISGYQPWGSDYHVLRADIGPSKLQE